MLVETSFKTEEEPNGTPGEIPEYGAIFMSNRKTKKECLSRKLFGLPTSYASFVNQVKSGMIIFLFEFERRKLYGVFKACYDGAMNIVPNAFISSGKQYPAQVKVTTLWECNSLSESEFRGAIRENYFSACKFHFGLSENQVHRLLYLFSSKILKDRPDGKQQSFTRVERRIRPSTDQVETVTYGGCSESIDRSKDKGSMLNVSCLSSDDYIGDRLGTIRELHSRFHFAAVNGTGYGLEADENPGPVQMNVCHGNTLARVERISSNGRFLASDNISNIYVETDLGLATSSGGSRDHFNSYGRIHDLGGFIMSNGFENEHNTNQSSHLTQKRGLIQSGFDTSVYLEKPFLKSDCSLVRSEYNPFTSIHSIDPRISSFNPTSHGDAVVTSFLPYNAGASGIIYQESFPSPTNHSVDPRISSLSYPTSQGDVALATFLPCDIDAPIIKCEGSNPIGSDQRSHLVQENIPHDGYVNNVVSFQKNLSTYLHVDSNSTHRLPFTTGEGDQFALTIGMPTLGAASTEDREEKIRGNERCRDIFYPNFTSSSVPYLGNKIVQQENEGALFYSINSSDHLCSKYPLKSQGGVSTIAFPLSNKGQFPLEACYYSEAPTHANVHNSCSSNHVVGYNENSGNLYPAQKKRHSVFSRLSLASEADLQENTPSCQLDSDDLMDAGTSVDEIMGMLRLNHEQWVKHKKCTPLTKHSSGELLHKRRKKISSRFSAVKVICKSGKGISSKPLSEKIRLTSVPEKGRAGEVLYKTKRQSSKVMPEKGCLASVSEKLLASGSHDKGGNGDQKNEGADLISAKNSSEWKGGTEGMPFINFKRRSELWRNCGIIQGQDCEDRQHKRRKLIRPKFGNYESSDRGINDKTSQDLPLTLQEGSTENENIAKFQALLGVKDNENELGQHDTCLYERSLNCRVDKEAVGTTETHRSAGEDERDPLKNVPKISGACLPSASESGVKLSKLDGFQDLTSSVSSKAMNENADGCSETTTIVANLSQDCSIARLLAVTDSSQANCKMYPASDILYGESDNKEKTDEILPQRVQMYHDKQLCPKSSQIGSSSRSTGTDDQKSEGASLTSAGTSGEWKGGTKVMPFIDFKSHSELCRNYGIIQRQNCEGGQHTRRKLIRPKLGNDELSDVGINGRRSQNLSLTLQEGSIENETIGKCQGLLGVKDDGNQLGQHVPFLHERGINCKADKEAAHRSRGEDERAPLKDEQKTTGTCLARASENGVKLSKLGCFQDVPSFVCSGAVNQNAEGCSKTDAVVANLSRDCSISGLQLVTESSQANFKARSASDISHGESDNQQKTVEVWPQHVQSHHDKHSCPKSGQIGSSSRTKGTFVRSPNL